MATRWTKEQRKKGLLQKQKVPRAERLPERGGIATDEVSPWVEPLSYDAPPPGPLAPSRVSLGELLTATAVAYACSIAAFNAGYFAALGGRFVELFTIGDLVGINVPILGYFISISFFIFLPSMLLSAVYPQGKIYLKHYVQRIALVWHEQPHLFWLCYGVLLMVFHLSTHVIRAMEVRSYIMIILPSVIFQGIIVSYFWIGYKFELVAVRTLAIAVSISLIVFSYTSGNSWLISEIRAPVQTQAIMTQDGQCLSRKLMRSSSNGLLLFNPYLRTFEFRSKEFLRVIYDVPSCP